MDEIKLYGGETIESAVKALLNAKAKGKQVFCDFNGVKLYSDNVTLDSAYIEICGCTKVEWEEKLRKDVEKIKKEREEDKNRAIKIIPILIEKGKALIYPFRHKEWTELVAADANGDYCGLITTDALKIMIAIEEEKPVEELVEMFKEQGHSGWSAGLTRNIILTYSRNGFPFYKATKYGEWTEEEYESVLKIMQENEEHSKDLRIASSVAESKREIIENQKKLVKSRKKDNNN